MNLKSFLALHKYHNLVRISWSNPSEKLLVKIATKVSCKLSPSEANKSDLKGGLEENQTAPTKEHSKNRWKSVSGKPQDLQEASILELK